MDTHSCRPRDHEIDNVFLAKICQPRLNEALARRMLALLVSVACLLAATASPVSAQEKSKPIVVCSTTQIADFAKQVVGDRWEVRCVLSAGEDPHTYEPRTSDRQMVQQATLCLENGWNLEGGDWMRTMATNAGKPIVRCVDGVQPLKTSAHGDDAGDAETVNDPHAWFNIDNAMIYVTNIRNAVREIDPANAAEYDSRTKLYLFQLRVLKQWVAQEVNSIPKSQRILVTHHDAFGYFSQAFGFRAESPMGWTTGEMTGVTIEKRQNVIKQIRELGVKCIFVETSVNQELLDGIANETGIKIGGTLYSDAMGVAGSAGETYIGMYRENVLTIVNGLK